MSISQVTDSMLNICKLRQDQWAFDVQSRIETAGDLFAADAVYYSTCHNEFSKITENSSVKRVGRPVNSEQELIFECLCDMLENCDSELYTLEDLRNKSEVTRGSEDVYIEKTIMNKLNDRYGEHIFCTNICGRRNVLCFKDLASRIVNDSWYVARDSDLKKDSGRIVKAAGEPVSVVLLGHSYIRRLAEYTLRSERKQNLGLDIRKVKVTCIDLGEATLRSIVGSVFSCL